MKKKKKNLRCLSPYTSLPLHLKPSAFPLLEGRAHRVGRPDPHRALVIKASTREPQRQKTTGQRESGSEELPVEQPCTRGSVASISRRKSVFCPTALEHRRLCSACRWETCVLVRAGVTFSVHANAQGRADREGMEIIDLDFSANQQAGADCLKVKMRAK